MQIHGPAEEADGSEFAARFNRGTERPFAVVAMGSITFFAYTPDECDAAIRVWAEAKQLLTGAQGDPEDEEDAQFAAEAAELDELEPLPARVGVPERMPIPASHYCDDPEVCEVCSDGPDVITRDSGPEQVTP